ncbi:MAG: beta-propeller domain-containing protein [Dorea sp.]
MKKNEQDILNIIDEKTRDMEIPECLAPEEIEKKLKEKELEIKRRNRKRYWQGLAAACVVLAVGVFVYNQVPRNIDKEAAENVATEVGQGNAQEEVIPTAETYEEIYTYMEEMYANQGYDSGFSVYDLFGFSGSGTEKFAEESVSDDSSVAMSTRGMGESGEYSTTNIRQDGVDEADSAKTDGEYLYILKDNGRAVSIVDTKDGLKEIHAIEVGEEYYIHEFYMLPGEKKVILICSYYEPEEQIGDTTREIACYRGAANKTCVITYDVQNVEKPKQTGIVSQSGSYSSSRMADGYVYLFSSYYGGNSLAKERPETYIPIVNEKLLEADDIYMPSLKHAYMYEIITSIDIDEPDKAADSKAIFSEGGQLYVSNENIYYYETRWDDNYESASTHVRKIAYDDGHLDAIAQDKIKGYINDSFSIDEYEGYLRVVTTVGETNSVYVFDEKLNMSGKIEGLAEDECIYSARFMGDIGYFVTFKEIDPLFTVDLSNPEEPKIIGKLKIPGFSEYLHFYGEDKLLGIGMNADEKTGTTEGVKISMFDISDKTDVKEEATYVLKNVYSTDVSYDYKAALIDVEKNIIGFVGYPEGDQKYYLFSYDEQNGFTCNMEEELNGNASRSARGLYIGDTLYVVQGNVIESYSLVSFKKEDDLIL